MINNPELFIKYLIDTYPDLYEKIKWKLIFSPSTSEIGFFNVNNPFEKKEDVAEFEKIILEYADM